MRRRRAMLPLAALLLCGGYTGYWFVGAGVVEGEVERWIAAQERAGMTVDVGDVSVEGFPLRFDAVLDRYALSRPDGMVVTGRDLKVGAPAWDWTLIGFSVDQEQSLALPLLPPLTVRTDDGQGEFRMEGGAPQSGSALVRNLVLEAPGGPPLTVAEVEYTQLLPYERDGVADPTFGGLTIAFRDIDLPAELLAGLGRHIDELSVDLAVSQPWPPAMRAPFLAFWRDSGGEVRVQRLVLRWGAFEVDAAGVLSLDANLQPVGELEAEVRGLRELMAALSADSESGGQQANLLGIGLGLFAGGARDGRVTLPLTVDGGRVRLGPVPLADLPRFDWPA